MNTKNSLHNNFSKIAFSGEVFYQRDFCFKAPQREVSSGEIVFIIGPNGSGKSTFLKGISGLLNYKEQKALYMSSHFSPQHGLTGNDLLELFDARTSPFFNKNLLNAFGVSGLLHAPLEDLSSGERQKIFLLAVLFHKSPVVALDEPLNYLDISYYSVFKKALKDYQRQGRIFFVSNHDLNWSLEFKNSQTWVVFQNHFVLCDFTLKVLNDIKLREVFGVGLKVIESQARSHVIIEDN